MKDPNAVALGRKGGLANKGIPKPASAENGKRGGRPKGSKNKPKAVLTVKPKALSELSYEPTE